MFLHLSRIVIAKTLLNIETKKKALKNTVKLARVSASNRLLSKMQIKYKVTCANCLN